MRKTLEKPWKVIYIRALFVILYSLLINPNGIYATTVENHRVLFISSYSPSFQTFFQQVEGIRSILDVVDIEIDIEFMDSKRFYNEENLTNFYNNLAYKISHLPAYDAVIVADDNALNFIMNNQTELFSKIPIVFMGINNLENAELASENPYITGVVEAVSIDDTIAIAQELNPEASNVIALTDNTNSGQGDLKTFFQTATNFPNLNFEVISLSEMTFNEFEDKLTHLNQKDIVLLLSVYSDKANERISFMDGISMIMHNCDQPVFHPYYHGISEGLIGGRVISHFEQGRKAAGIVKNVLSGIDIANIESIKESPNQYVFNYNVLKHYNIDKNKLPENTILLHYEESIIKKYWLYFTGAIIIITLQMAIIVALKNNMREKNIAESKLKKNQKKLIEANNDLTAANEELHATFEEVESQNRRIQELIYEDKLTSLKNRYAMIQTIDKLIEDQTHCSNMAIMFLDVDNFKYINDTLGHDVGDRVIQITGEKLKIYENTHIDIGRFGGDEFLIVINNYKSGDEINQLVTSIQNIFADEIFIDDNKLYLTVSIGIALYPSHGGMRNELIKKADMALYRAKALGKNTHVFYDDSMNKALEEKLILQGAIKQAVRKQEFTLYYQPYVDANTHRIVGFEALIRWFSDVHGEVSPYKLITNAEEMGLIVEIGKWVLQEACQFAKTINSGREKPLVMSVNVSAVQLKYSGFYDQVMDVINEIGIEPQTLCLEMTETVLLESLESSVNTIQQLRDQGILIALDDFGSGYSSLKYLKELPVNVMKIDRSFINHVANNEYDQFFVDAMIMIAHKKELRVIAEGIENKEQLKVLTTKGCDFIQGYYFSRPIPEKDAEALVSGNGLHKL